MPFKVLTTKFKTCSMLMNKSIYPRTMQNNYLPLFPVCIYVAFSLHSSSGEWQIILHTIPGHCCCNLQRDHVLVSTKLHVSCSKQGLFSFLEKEVWPWG